MSSTELCGIEAFYVDTCWILNAMPSTGLCGIEAFKMLQCHTVQLMA
jgi:hypothetical protein